MERLVGSSIQMIYQETQGYVLLLAVVSPT
jgi:hypothetical protein